MLGQLAMRLEVMRIPEMRAQYVWIFNEQGVYIMERKNSSLNFSLIGQVVLIIAIIFLAAANASGQEDLETANTLNQQVIKLYNEGRYQEAIPLAERSLAIVEKALGPEDRRVAISLNNLGLLYQATGEYSRAEPLLQRSLVIRELETATTLELQAFQLYYVNMFSYVRDSWEAIPLAERALTIRENALGPEHQDVAASLNNLAMLYSDMVGDHSRAEPLYQRSLAIKEKALGPEHPDVALRLNNLARLYIAMGDYGRAEPLYQRSLSIIEKAPTPGQLSALEIEGDIGRFYLAQGKLDEAYQIFKKQEKKEYISHELSKYYLLTGNHQEAARRYSQIMEEFVRFERRGDPHRQGVTIGLGLAKEGLKQYAEAARAFEEAVAVMEEERIGLDPYGKTHFLSGEAGLFKRIEAYEGLVRAKAAMQDQAGAFFWSEHTKARQLIDALPRGKTAGVLPASLSQREQELTTKLAELYRQPEAFDEKELSRARQELARFVETLQKEQPLYAAVNYPQPLPVSQFKLHGGEALIAYEVTEEKTLGWLIRDGKIITSVNIPISRKDLTEKITRYRKCFESVENYDELAQFDPHLGKALYDLIIKPFAGHLTPKDRLIIVPDEILGILPFETLVANHPEEITWKVGEYGPVPQEVTYLGDMFPISYSQSATTLTLSRTLQPAVASPSDKMLVLADPVFDLTDARLENQSTLLAQKPDEYQMHLRRAVAEGFKGLDAKPEFGRLYATRQLGEKLGGIYPGSIEVLKGLDASERELRRKLLDRYGYHVFATHGILDNQIPYIQEPALMLSQVGINPRVPEEDGFLTMSEVMGLRLQAQLVALTACSTGVGKRLTGEGVMGMGRAFQYAGAQSVLMSLWSVEDESTNLLTERLFSHLKEGKSRMEAIRQARADLRQTGYEHPFFWAPFILVGKQ